MSGVRRGLRACAPVALAVVAFVAVAPAVPVAAQAPDVSAIQAQEARRTDERTLAALERFRAALIARAGPDPLLSMLVFDEQEGQALVHAAASGPAEHVIWQRDRWIATEGRQLKPWAPQADPARARFHLSAVTEAFVRSRLRAHRAQAGQAADHLGPVRVGYFGPPIDRLLLEVQVASMTRFGLSAVQFDLASGASVDVAGAAQRARAGREADAK